MPKIFYQHYKTIVPNQTFGEVPLSHLYEVVAHAIDEKSMTPLVVYRNVGQNLIWARTEEEFYGSVAVEAGVIPRFKPHIRSDAPTPEVVATFC